MAVIVIVKPLSEGEVTNNNGSDPEETGSQQTFL